MSGSIAYTPLRGELTALVGLGTHMVVATRHAEGQETGVWFVDSAKPSEHARRAPHIPGATAMVADATNLYMAGVDGTLWRSNRELGALKALGSWGQGEARAMALWGGEEELAIASGKGVVIVSRKTGAQAHLLQTQEEITALASDATGTWLVAGTAGGTLTVWQRRDASGAPELEGSARIHDGKVTALCFDPDELQVLSAGEDAKLLVTYVRGTLDPQDRSGSDSDDKPITAILFGPFGRVYTAGLSRSIKAWPVGRNKKRPASQTQGVPKVVDMALVTHHDRPHLALLGTDRTVRLFGLEEEEGKVTPLVLTIAGAVDQAKKELESKNVGDRQQAIAELARHKDKLSLDVLIKHLGRESDHKLLVFLTKSLSQTGDRRVAQALESLLSHAAAQVQESALGGLMALETRRPLRPLELALRTSQETVAKLAVDELGKLAKGQDSALELLIKTLDHGKFEVRVHAFRTLVQHHVGHETEAYLLGLHAPQPDVRIVALLGCHRDRLLDDGRIEAALRRLCEDPHERVRTYAFHISLYRQPALVLALRARDEEVHRALFEIEQVNRGARGEGELPRAAAFELGKLKEKDVEPLLEAMASSQVDVSVRAARALAALEDSRALGTLLQLSRHGRAEVRVGAARALGTLGDPRGISRLNLMLRDADPRVRDAAFDSLAKLGALAPVDLAKVGLYVEHEDVNKRGLHVLTTALETQAGHHDPEALALLAATLNSPFGPVRTEALKAALRLGVGGGQEAALRFGRQSIHAEVRLGVLREVMAAYKEGWAWNMLLEFYEDADPKLRRNAFDFAIEKARKARRHQALATALQSAREEVRLWGLEELGKKQLEEVEDLMLLALGDESLSVRAKAVEALVEAGANGLLAKAMASTYPDVQLLGARALASTGHKEALPVLLGIATAQEPDKETHPAAHERWGAQVIQALGGLALLGEPGAELELQALLDSPYGPFRQAAAHAIVWSATAQSVPILEHMLQHEDPNVRHEAAFGLAYFGHPSATVLVSGKRLSVGEIVSHQAQDQAKLLAAFGLLSTVPEFLTSLLDDPTPQLRGQAFLLILLLTQARRDEAMSLCLGALASQHGQIRLEAAKAFEAYIDQDTFLAFVRAELGSVLATGKQGFEVPEEAVKTLSLVLAKGHVQLQLRAVMLLGALVAEQGKPFERAWEAFSTRHASDIHALQAAQAAAAGSAPTMGRLERAWGAIRGLSRKKASGEEITFSLLQLAFGAYVGLVREHADEPTTRLGAMRRLGQMSRHGDVFAHECHRVMLMCLGDAQQAVRGVAFETLLESGFDPQKLAHEALSTSYADMGSRGLSLLARHAGAGAGLGLLQEVMLQKTDGLEVEAAKLLEPQMPFAAFWALGLGAKSPSWRLRAVDALQARVKDSPEAQEALGKALSSRFEEIRFKVAGLLSWPWANKQQKTALLPVLREMLWSDEAATQLQAGQAIVRLGDPALAPLLLDRLDDDPEKTATSDLLTCAGEAGDVTMFDRLLTRLEQGRGDQSKTFHAALTLTGYHQPLKGNAETAARIKDWSADQKARHTPELIALLDLAGRLARPDMLRVLIPQATWALGSEVDAALIPLLTSSHAEVQAAAIEAYGWRLKWRTASPRPLVALLGEGSATAQFLAAEGLAKAHLGAGLSVLMTAVSFLESQEYRRRAVLAIGELGDPQTIPLLLGIAQDPEHELCAAAIQALGHLGGSEKADVIFDLLVQMTTQDGPLAVSAIKGLAYMGHDAAWQHLRRLATNPSAWIRQHAVEALGIHNDEDTQALLAKTLRHDQDWSVENAALKGLRAFYGEESLEPDYLQLQARYANLEGWQELIKRVTDKGDPVRLLKLLPQIPHPRFVEQLVSFLVATQPLEAAAASLSQDALLPALVSAKIIAYAGPKARAHQKLLLEATAQAAATWEALRAQTRPDLAALKAQSQRLGHLLWACGQVQVGLEEITHAAGRFDDRLASDTCQIALNILGFEWVGKKGVPTFRAALGSDIPKHREIAALALRVVDPEAAIALLPQTLDDAILFDHLEHDPRDARALAVARQGVGNVHQQGVVLPTLVAQGDISSLAVVATDASLGDEVRLGALEALSLIATPQTDALLAQVGKDDQEDEELRKSAWRALRRSKTLRARRDHKEVAP